MKNYYLFLVVAILSCMGSANSATDNLNGALSNVLKILNTRQQSPIVVCEVLTEDKSENFITKSGKTAYGYITCDDDWNYDYEHSGLCSFDVASPQVLKQEFENGLGVIAGSYYNGFIYAEVGKSTDGGFNFVSLDFCKIDIKTGECTIIADWLMSGIYCVDMTYDYSSNTLLGIAKTSETSYKLYRVNMDTGELILIGDAINPVPFISLACSHDGIIYAVDIDGNLVTIDQEGVAVIGNTGEILDDFGGVYLQSMEFDHSDGTLYWAVVTGDSKTKSGIIDIETGKFTSNGTLGNNASIAALYFPFDGVDVESAGEIQFDIYPNPASETINISGDFTMIGIYNSIGQCVGTYSGETTKIDVSNLSEGVYVIKVTNGNVHLTRKIIVRK